ncbi:hypothetical protein [Rhizobium sp. LjRoot254]|uniref:hypothetical protein n=1 Tax=Rhizobium sp. LjRoot254 TaxID=3342297 RepID=UPI003ED041D6
MEEIGQGCASGAVMPLKRRLIDVNFQARPLALWPMGGRIAARWQWQSVGGVSDRISAKVGKQIARDVTN